MRPSKKKEIAHIYTMITQKKNIVKMTFKQHN